MLSPRIAIVALGAVNRRSIARGIERAGGEAVFVGEPRAVEGADGLVIPGVANLGYLTQELDRRGLRARVREAVAGAMPCLGICAGFQLMFESSEEAPNELGLGIFRGTVRRLRGPKSPHIGWNFVETSDPAFESGWAYFAHSYAPPADVPAAIAVTSYGVSFASAGSRGSAIGVQFHPERSGRYGAGILERFVALAGACRAR